MIVALARKLLIAFWRMVRTGEVPGRRLSHRLSRREEALQDRKPALDASCGFALTIRGSGTPYCDTAFEPPGRMEPLPGTSPPMRITASWFGSHRPTEYKYAAR